ncbi:MAG: nitroreductase family protein [Bifidobacteriaceae bacterium]|jgi:nitroreductase|nr:nitroreductase family protein [Bifidobacteriaceae bacterium]
MTKRRRRWTGVLIAALAVLAVTGWGWAVWLRFTTTPLLTVAAKESIALNPVFSESDSAVVQALERRNSTKAADFTDQPVDADRLQALFWAATGKNRDGTGFVVPLAMHAEPYVSVYGADEDGVRQFDWRQNGFISVSGADVRAALATQDFARQAPHLMLFVINTADIPSKNTDWGYVAVGAMTQNVYLLADDLNVQARFIAGIDPDAARAELGLTDGQVPVGAIVLASK